MCFRYPACLPSLNECFSGVKHTISDERASLKPDTIEALECCKSMLRAGVFTDGDIRTAIARELEDIQE